MRLKSLFLEFLTFFAFLLMVQSSYVSDIDKFAKKIAAVNDATIDVLETLEKVGKNSKGLLRAGVPLGALVAAGLDIIFDPESDEQQTITNLFNNMTEQFRLLDVKLEKYEKYSSSNRIDLDYQNKVTIPLSVAFVDFKHVTSPFLPHHAFKTEFLATCTSIYKPRAMLEYLNNIFNLNCPMPTIEYIENYIKLQKVLFSIEQQFKSKNSRFWSHKYEEIKSTIMSKLGSLDDTDVNDMIAVLEKISASNIDDFISELTKTKIYEDDINDKPCMLSIISNRHDHKRLNLFSTVEELIIDLVKIELITMACVNATNAGDAAAINQVILESSELIETISKKVVKWIRKSQELTWPKIPMATVEREVTAVDIPSFNVTSQLIQEIFEAKGAESDSYEVVIAESKEKDTYWNIRDSEYMDNYASLINFKGINIHVIKYAQGASQRATEANKWFLSNKEAIYQQIIKGRASTSTSGVLGKLQELFGIVHHDRYRVAMLFRNVAFWKSHSLIPLGIASWDMLGVNSTNAVVYHENDFDAYTYKLILLL